MGHFEIFVFLLLMSSVVGVSQPVDCQCGKVGDAVSTRVVYGASLGERSHPFLAFIVAKNVLCGGSIISPRFVLTAAHCLEKKTPEDIDLKVGVTDRLEAGKSTRHVYLYIVEDIIRHEHFANIKDMPMNDIALLKTTTEIAFNDYVKPVCLPFKLEMSHFKAGMVIGWGLTEAELLPRYPRATFVTLLTPKQCEKSWYYDLDLDIMLCAFNRASDACLADANFIHLDGNRLEWKSTVKCLGVLLDKRLTRTPHINRLYNLAMKELRMVSSLLGSRNLLIKTKVLQNTAPASPCLRGTSLAPPCLQNFKEEVALCLESLSWACHKLTLVRQESDH